jgi:hypothetical protein
VALVPRLGQAVMAMGWITLVVMAFQRLCDVKALHQLTGTMQIYKFVTGSVAVTILSYMAYFSFLSAPKAMQLPLVRIAEFLVIQNMVAAMNSAIIAALGISIADAFREFIRAPR